jgi:hypothetical protein
MPPVTGQPGAAPAATAPEKPKKKTTGKIHNGPEELGKSVASGRSSSQLSDKPMPPRGGALSVASADQAQDLFLNEKNKAQQKAKKMLERHADRSKKSDNLWVVNSGILTLNLCFDLERLYGSAARKMILNDINFASFMCHVIAHIQFRARDMKALREPIQAYIEKVYVFAQNAHHKDVDIDAEVLSDQVVTFDEVFAGLMRECKKIRSVSSSLPCTQDRFFDLLRDGTIPDSKFESDYPFFRTKPSQNHARIGVLMMRCDSLELPTLLFATNLIYNSEVVKILGFEFNPILQELVAACKSIDESGVYSCDLSRAPARYYSPSVKLESSAREFAKALVDQICHLRNIMEQKVSRAQSASASSGETLAPAAMAWIESLNEELLHLQGLAEEMLELAPPPTQAICLREGGFMPVVYEPETVEPDVEAKVAEPCVAERQRGGGVVLRKRKSPKDEGGASADVSGAERAVASSPTSTQRDPNERYVKPAQKLLTKFEADFSSDCAQCTSQLDTRPPSTTLAIVEWMSSSWKEQARRMRSVAGQLRREAAADLSNANWCDQVRELAQQLEATAARVDLRVAEQVEQADGNKLIKLHQFPQAADWKALLNAGHVRAVSQPRALASTPPNTLFECRIDPVQDPGEAPYKPVFVHMHTAKPVADPAALKSLSKADFAAVHLKSDEQKNLGAHKYGGDVHRSKISDDFRRELLNWQAV